jgi:hypothetical protein
MQISASAVEQSRDLPSDVVERPVLSDGGKHVGQERLP